MNKNLTPAPIDEKNVCGSFIIDYLENEYDAVMSTEKGRKTYVAIFVGKNIVRIDWTFGHNEFRVYGDEQIAVNDVALFLQKELNGEFTTKCLVGNDEVILRAYFKNED